MALPGSGMAEVFALVSKSNVDEPGVFRFLVAQGKLPSCGNGTLEVCEECDDDNDDDNDACTNLCWLNVCGDGFVHHGSPVCNDDCTLSDPPVGCVDIDECADAGLNGCGPNAICIDLPGGYPCACSSGYAGDGKSCEDVDECADPLLNDCDENATRTNTDGGFVCGCKEGYEGDGQNCTDIDECADPSSTRATRALRASTRMAASPVRLRVMVMMASVAAELAVAVPPMAVPAMTTPVRAEPMMPASIRVTSSARRSGWEQVAPARCLGLPSKGRTPPISFRRFRPSRSSACAGAASRSDVALTSARGAVRSRPSSPPHVALPPFLA